MMVQNGAGAAIMISPANFMNTRTTFQRMKDAKINHGWVEAFDDREIAVRVFNAADYSEGDCFYFQVFGIEEDAQFKACLTTKLTGSFMALDDQATASTLCMFSINGGIKNSKAAGNARLANQGVMVVVEVDGAELTVEPVEALDVSPKGLAVPLATQLAKETVVKVRATTVMGQVEMMAVVRNLRKVEGQDGFFRHGLEIQQMHRIDQLRWAQLFKQGL